MERLTYGLGSYNRTYGLVDKASAKPGLFTDYNGFYANLLAHHRLGQYEDILFDPDGKELVTVEHLTELVKAESEGRSVVLPCKVGDSVFSLLSPPHYKHGVVYEYKVVFIGINDSKDMGYGLFNVKSVKGEWMYPFNFSDIGVTVFLPRAEAEAALGGGGDG